MTNHNQPTHHTINFRGGFHNHLRKLCEGVGGEKKEIRNNMNVIKKTPNINTEWSDTEIAEEVKKLSAFLKDRQIPGYKGVAAMASIYNLLNMCFDVNATIEFELKGFYHGNSEKRDYKIKIDYTKSDNP